VVCVLFVSGFNRSGTTLVTSAVTAAAHATTLTVGDLARHMPSVDEFMRAAEKRDTPPDRGVDRLPVTESTPEEYGWLLRASTGEFGFGQKAVESRVLHALVEEIADGDGTVVLKNPWDTTNEQLLLDSFPGSRVVLVRRGISAIEHSLRRAWERMATSNEYVQALIADPGLASYLVGVMVDPEARRQMVDDTRRKLRRDAVRLARSVSGLPLDRVALLSYDELRENPRAGAAWAAHLVDPDALARAVSTLSFPEYNRVRPDGWAVRAIDRYWARAWRQTRAKQVKAGIVPRPPRRRV